MLVHVYLPCTTNVQLCKLYINFTNSNTETFFYKYRNCFLHSRSEIYEILSKKPAFTKEKKLKKIDVINVNNILVSKKEPYGTRNSFKYFIGYNDIIRPLCIRLPQMTGYNRNFNENSTMSFRVEDKQLLKNYNKIWEKVEKLAKIEFESKPVYGDEDKYIKTKIKTWKEYNYKIS